MATGIFLTLDQLIARITALEAEVQPGSSQPLAAQVAALTTTVTTLQTEVGTPDAPVVAAS